MNDVSWLVECIVVFQLLDSFGHVSEEASDAYLN